MREPPPPPEELETYLRGLAVTIARLLETYRWAYPAAHSPSRGEATRSGPGHSDPTGGTFADERKRWIRDALRRAAKRAVTSHNQLSNSITELRKAMDSKAGKYEPVQVLKPWGLSRAEFSESLDAKKRREDRGEGWGEG